MKISGLVFGVVAAGKGGKGGKHGNVDMEGDWKIPFPNGYDWNIPKCITSPDLCQDTIITAEKGKIELSAEDYENHKNVMYRIQLGDSKKIKLKFNKEAGFGMEWHRKCGYDQVHIFNGRADDFENAHRIARFCGPKRNQVGGAPFDASRNIRPLNGKMAMWDEWMDVGSGEIVVAIDLDQGQFYNFTCIKQRWAGKLASKISFGINYETCKDRVNFKGFVLEYESESIGVPDFSDFKAAAEFLHKSVLLDTLQFDLVNTRPPIAAAKNLYSK